MVQIPLFVIFFFIGLLVTILASLRGRSWKPWAILAGGIIVYAILMLILGSFSAPTIEELMPKVKILDFLMNLVFPVTDVVLIIMIIVGNKSKARV